MFARLVSAVVAVALLGLWVGGASAVDPKDLVGKYDIVSTTADGRKVEGTAEITFKKGRTVEVAWQYNDRKRKDIGVGQLKGNRLTVTYNRAVVQTQGKAEYTVQPDGSLVGTWEETNAKTGPLSGTETMTPRK